MENLGEGISLGGFYRGVWFGQAFESMTGYSFGNTLGNWLDENEEAM